MEDLKQKINLLKTNRESLDRKISLLEDYYLFLEKNSLNGAFVDNGNRLGMSNGGLPHKSRSTPSAPKTQSPKPTHPKLF
jgi:hypothetical protein